MPKRIAIVLPALFGGGVERVRLLLAEQFLSRGYSVDLVLLQGRGELLSEVPEGCHLEVLGASRLRHAALKLTGYFRRAKPDAVLAAMWPLTGLVGLALRMAHSNATLVASEHADFRQMRAIKPWERLLLRLLGPWLYARATKVVAVSRGVGESLSSVARLDPNRIDVIYNPVRQFDPTSTMPDELHNWWMSSSNRILAVGRLTEQKDFPTLVHALSLVRQRVDARLIILGEGPERAVIERLTVELGLDDSVRLPGFVKNIQSHFRHASLFVLSSRWEGLGNVIIEALLEGIPVVSTNCQSGPAELLEDGRFGRLVPVGDPNSLATAIVDSLSATHDKQKLRARGRQFNAEAAAISYLTYLDGCGGPEG